MNDRSRRILGMLVAGEIAGAVVFGYGAGTGLDPHTRVQIAAQACDFFHSSWPNGQEANSRWKTTYTEIDSESYMVISETNSNWALAIICGKIAGRSAALAAQA
jgi:hypothetical protein